MDPDAPEGIDIKGIQLVRRDSFPLLKDASTDILDAIMYAKDTDAAMEAARRHVRALFEADPVDLVRMLSVSKALRNDYKTDTQPHARVAKKIAARRGVPVPTGTRVAYVVVDDPDNPAGLQYERAEDPEHVVQHDLRVDLLHYLNLMMSAFETLLGVLVKDPVAEVLGHPSVAGLVEAARSSRKTDVTRYKRQKKNRDNRQAEITTFFKPS